MLRACSNPGGPEPRIVSEVSSYEADKINLSARLATSTATLRGIVCVGEAVRSDSARPLHDGSPLDYIRRVSIPVLVTVVETPEFIARIAKLMPDQDRQEPVDDLARHPSAGDLMPGAGGVRKLRWKLLTTFAKNERRPLPARPQCLARTHQAVERDL